jgi:hypothetical protein
VKTPANWKHNAVLILTCLFGFVVFSPETFQRFPVLIAIAKFAMAGGLAKIGIDSHNQSVANAAAIQSVDSKVVETHTAIDGRMDELVKAANAQGRQEQRAETRQDEHDARGPWSY